MILGDSLQVMTSLGEREQLSGSVQMIYIDPPYGIKFGSNWQVSARNRTVRDGSRRQPVHRLPAPVFFQPAVSGSRTQLPRLSCGFRLRAHTR